MTIDVPPQFQRYVDELVKDGHYATADDAIMSAIAHLHGQIKLTAFTDPAEIEELRALIDEGLADLKAGRVEEFDAESIIAECRAERGLPPRGK